MPWEALAFWSLVMAMPFIIVAIIIRITREPETKKITIETGNSAAFTIPAKEQK